MSVSRSGDQAAIFKGEGRLGPKIRKGLAAAAPLALAASVALLAPAARAYGPLDVAPPLKGVFNVSAWGPWQDWAPVVAVAAAMAIAVAILLRAQLEIGHARRRAERAETRAQTIGRRLDRAESVLAAEPGLVMVWPISLDDKDAAPLSFGALGSFRSIPSGGEGDRFQMLLAALGSEDGERLRAAVAALRREGAAFSISVATQEGVAVNAEGRPAGSQAVMWLRDGTVDRAERDRLAGALADSDAKTAAQADLLDRLPIPLWRRNAALDLVWVNSAYARAVEAESPESVIAAQSEFDSGTRALAHAARRERALRRETRSIVQAGERRVVELGEVPLGEESVGFAIDVTALDEARQEISHHVEATRDTLDHIHTAVAIFGPDKGLRFFNRACVELWQLEPSWLASGPKEGEVLEALRELRLLPEQANFPAWKRRRLALYNNVIERPDELWHLPDGRTLRVVCRPHPQGGLTYLYEDVTDRLALESSLKLVVGVQRASLDNLYEGVALFGSDGRLKLFNPAFARIWSLEPGTLADEPHFKHVAEMCVGLLDDGAEWERLAGRVTSLDPVRRPSAGRFERRDGTVVNYNVIPLPDGATLLTFLDVSDTTRIERALRERNDALEAADRIKSDFVSHVSYQLRTPLNTIIGFSTMLDEAMLAEPLTPKQGEYVGNVLEASNQLLRLIDDILDLATIEAGRMTLDLTEMDVTRALEAAASLTRKRAQESRLQLTIDVAGDVGVIAADERRIKQVVFNLLQNAIAFTPPGGQIHLGATRSGGEIRLFVSDTGEGIAPRMQPTVFDRFESRGTDGRRGAGLGLSLVKSFVQLHNGWVELQSVPGKGTTVTCHLPDRARQPESGLDAAE